jgi:hypothetical protein
VFDVAKQPRHNKTNRITLILMLSNTAQHLPLLPSDIYFFLKETFAENLMLSDENGNISVTGLAHPVLFF